MFDADDTAQMLTTSTNKRLAPQQLESTAASCLLSLEIEFHMPALSTSKWKSDSQQALVPK